MENGPWDSNSGWVSNRCSRGHNVDKWNLSLPVCSSCICCPAAMGCICCSHRKLWWCVCCCCCCCCLWMADRQAQCAEAETGSCAKVMHPPESGSHSRHFHIVWLFHLVLWFGKSRCPIYWMWRPVVPVTEIFTMHHSYCGGSRPWTICGDVFEFVWWWWLNFNNLFLGRRCMATGTLALTWNIYVVIIIIIFI